ncbi:peptidoglycan/LPS O-acetylase OafA/YrhL [Streptomyces achromogenes]|uniref:Peptidoglycan/LPS O-acetylase OafA/YrhL n=1 Tax=Streptomyces achromogenes TaxID=67255 RepID=A0ABU0PZK5_STRAH|nr:acyltransferase [Streptomyces achromogenes]MDQ0683841.1 peptidoglycan/LPS O-acetylase OafA/YrhL [Streptomyces achromogenes]MDQ0830952.1 peptidoglycan/LPS O-acetylase OafA/YrhL [Streptomyces achromogenes]
MSQTDVKVSALPDAPDAPGTVPPRQSRGNRLYALDALRVIAALSVLIFHFTGVDAATKANWGVNPKALFPSIFPYTSYGSYGVQLFFIISGFVICLSAWNRTPGQFVQARFLRLFPAYWFSVVVAVVVWRALPDGARKAPSVSDSLTNLTMFQVPLSARHLVGAYWTLWVELTFYLIFLVVLWKGLDYVRVSVFCWLWLLASVLVQEEKFPLLGIFAQPLNTALFVSGIAMYLMYRFGPDLKLWGLLGASWLVMQSDLVQHADHLRHDKGMDRSPYVALALVTVFYLLVLAVALHKLDRIGWKWLSTAGALVYPLYLLHEELGWAMIRTLYGHVGAWATLAITTVSLIVLAWLVHRFVEKPSQRWLRARLDKESRGRAAAAEA